MDLAAIICRQKPTATTTLSVVFSSANNTKNITSKNYIICGSDYMVLNMFSCTKGM